MSAYFFLHVPSSRSWPTDNPHKWLINRRDDEILAEARERLLLSPNDADRCLRVVLRRCDLVLIQIVADDRIVVHHWSDPAPDLRAFAKVNRLARAGIQVVFANSKNGKLAVHKNAEDLLLFGVRVGPRFPWSEYAEKYERLHAEEAGDKNAASAAYTNFLWETERGGPHERLTWQVLKAVWNAERVECPNCDMPLVLVGFEWRIGMLSFRSGRSVRVCPQCRRRFDRVEETPLAWLASVLPPDLRPTQLRLWDTGLINWPRLSLAHHRPVQFVDREG
jgi:hypothetical protein